MSYEEELHGQSSNGTLRQNYQGREDELNSVVSGIDLQSQPIGSYNSQTPMSKPGSEYDGYPQDEMNSHMYNDSKASYNLHHNVLLYNENYDVKHKMEFDQKLGMVTKMLQDLANDVHMLKPEHLDSSKFVQYITRTTSDLKKFMDNSFPPYSMPDLVPSVPFPEQSTDVESYTHTQIRRKRFQPTDNVQYSRTPPADVPHHHRGVSEKKEVPYFHPVNESPLDFFVDRNIKIEYEGDNLDYYTKKQKVVGSIPTNNDILDPIPQAEIEKDEPISTRRPSRRASQRKSLDYPNEEEDDYEYEKSSWNYTRRTPDKKKDKKKTRTRLPKDTLEEWGFGPEDIKREFELELQRAKDKPSDKRGYKWARIAKRIGNEKFLASGDCGTKLKAILRRHYPNLVGLKIKIPDDPKKEWGFTSQDVVNKLDELSKQGKKVSLSKIGYLLGHKTSDDDRRKAFADRCDRGQLVHALLQYDFPDVAKRFERGGKKESVDRNSLNSSNDSNSGEDVKVKPDPYTSLDDGDDDETSQSLTFIEKHKESSKLNSIPYSPELMSVNTPTITNSPLGRIEMMSISGETPPPNGHSPNPLTSVFPSSPGLSNLSPPPLGDVPLLEGLEGSYNIFLHNSTPGTSPVVEISSV